MVLSSRNFMYVSIDIRLFITCSIYSSDNQVAVCRHIHELESDIERYSSI